MPHDSHLHHLEKTTPFPGNKVPSRIHAPRTPCAVRRSPFSPVTCQLNQICGFVQKVSLHRPNTAFAAPGQCGVRYASLLPTRSSMSTRIGTRCDVESHTKVPPSPPHLGTRKRASRLQAEGPNTIEVSQVCFDRFVALLPSLKIPLLPLSSPAASLFDIRKPKHNSLAQEGREAS
jgi:hypothetical protein